MIAQVRNEQIARRIHGDADRVRQAGTRGRPAIPAKAKRPITGDGANEPGAGRHFANPAIALVRNEQIARRIHRDAARVRQAGTRGRPAIPAEARGPSTGDGANEPGAGRHFANPVIANVRNEQIARRIHGNACWASQRHLQGRHVISRSTAGHRIDIPCGLAD